MTPVGVIDSDVSTRATSSLGDRFNGRRIPSKSGSWARVSPSSCSAPIARWPGWGPTIC